MARRSTVQADPRIAGDLESSARPETSAFDARRPHRGWPGSGGRWLVATGRVIVWALILVVLLNGVIAIISRFREESAPSSVSPSAGGVTFPAEEATAFAVQFANLYLDLNPDELEIRAARLKPYLPQDAADQFGWDGYGRMQAAYIQPYRVEHLPNDPDDVVVTVSFQSASRRFLLSVPVHWDGNTASPKFVVSGRPGLLPAPGAAEIPVLAQPEVDEVATAELRPQLAEFFTAYASGVQLNRYLATGTSLPSLGGAFTFVELKSVVVPVGGATRWIQAVVVWGVPSGSAPTAQPTPTEPSAAPGRLEQAYRLNVEKQGDKWYVKDILGAGQAVG
ncbi:conjugal transfer protein [Thermoactinospora rubra]|uniref:conjugal transfer protein n=1 Tax=Thermoactinospora rubra TaxID=1088767 RepID=UPI000A101877|nr:conjugal transfer protein [Thermoactinospora rubra]